MNGCCKKGNKCLLWHSWMPNLSRNEVSIQYAPAGKVEDMGTGEYRARFTATSAGTYSVSIQHKGENIAGSPFPAEVRHSVIDADSSYVVQEGIERGISGVQVPAKVLVLSHSLEWHNIICKHCAFDRRAPLWQAYLLHRFITE